MFCKSCGTMIENDEALFCAKCGTRIKDECHSNAREIEENKKRREIKLIHIMWHTISTLKYAVTNFLLNITGIMKKPNHKKTVIGISIIFLCVLTVGIYLGYDSQTASNNDHQQTSSELSKKAQISKGEISTQNISNQNTSVVDTKAYNEKDFEFITNEQKEDDKDAFGSAAESIVIDYMNKIGERKHKEAYDLFTPRMKAKAGAYNDWAKQFVKIQDMYGVQEIEKISVSDNTVILRYRVLMNVFGYNQSINAQGIAKVTRDGIKISIDDI